MQMRLPLPCIINTILISIECHVASCNEHAQLCEPSAHGLLKSTHAWFCNLQMV